MSEHGLADDLLAIEQRVSTRRRLLGWLASLTAAPILGCDGRAPTAPLMDASIGAGGSDGLAPADAGSTAGRDASAGAANGGSDAGALPDPSCVSTPAETGGPFPADSTIGPNVLLRSGIVRSDIRSSFAVGTATAEGVALQITLTVVDGRTCRPLTGAVIYLWHCDRDGRYSLYSAGATDQDYLRGALQTADDGTATFTTIFPGCYPGRWPHVHFEVFENLAVATTAGSVPLLKSQFAFPQDACELAYAATGYQASVTNLQQLDLATDGVFADGVDQQLATVTGTVSGGLLARFSLTAAVT